MLIAAIVKPCTCIFLAYSSSMHCYLMTLTKFSCFTTFDINQCCKMCFSAAVIVERVIPCKEIVLCLIFEHCDLAKDRWAWSGSKLFGFFIPERFKKYLQMTKRLQNSQHENNKKCFGCSKEPSHSSSHNVHPGWEIRKIIVNSFIEAWKYHKICHLI